MDGGDLMKNKYEISIGRLVRTSIGDHFVYTGEGGDKTCVLASKQRCKNYPPLTQPLPLSNCLWNTATYVQKCLKIRQKNLPEKFIPKMALV